MPNRFNFRWDSYTGKIRLAFFVIALLLTAWAALIISRLNMALQEVRYLQEVIVPIKVQSLLLSNAVNNSKASLYRYAISFSTDDKNNALHYLSRQGQGFTAQSAIDSLLALRGRLAKTEASDHAFYLIQDLERAFHDVSDQYALLDMLTPEEQKGLIMNAIVNRLRAINTFAEDLAQESSIIEKKILDQSAWEVEALMSNNFYMLFFLVLISISVGVAGILMVLWLSSIFQADVQFVKEELLFSLRNSKSHASGSLVKNQEFKELIVAAKDIEYELQQVEQFAKNIVAGNKDETLIAFKEHKPRAQAFRRLSSALTDIRKREEQQDWLQKGIADLSNTIRESTQDTQVLCDNFLRELIDYGGFCQGAIYLYDRTQQLLNLEACYAYHRKRHLQLQIMPDDGLVGEAFSDQEPIMMTDIPANYSRILVGVGEIPPTAVFIVPLSYQSQAIGALELTSTRTFAPIEQTLILKAVEVLASNLLNVINRSLTEELIDRLMDSTKRGNEQELTLKKALDEALSERETKQKELAQANRLLEAYQALISQYPLPASISYSNSGTIIAASPAMKELCRSFFTEYQERLSIYQLLPALRVELQKNMPSGNIERIQIKTAPDKTLSVKLRYYTAGGAFMVVWIDGHN